MNRLTLIYDRLILSASLLFLAFALILSGRAWLYRATAPALRPHAVLRIALPGLDVGAEAWSAQVGASGYVELWAMPQDADDIQPLLRVFGTPALPPYTPPAWPCPLPQMLA